MGLNMARLGKSSERCKKETSRTVQSRRIAPRRSVATPWNIDAQDLVDWDFGPRTSFGFRISIFGFHEATTAIQFVSPNFRLNFSAICSAAARFSASANVV